DKLKYQKLLFEKSLGITNLNLTNNFNYSLLKKRLKMMTKKSNSIVKIKYLLSMPTMLLIMILFAVNLNSYGQDKIYTEVDVMAEYKEGGILGMRTFVQKNVFYPKSAIKDNISAIIYVQFDIDEKGNVTNVKINRSDTRNNEIDEVIVTTSKPKTSSETTSKSLAVLEAEAIRLISLLKGFTPAQKDGKNVKSQFTFPINFQIAETEG
ncbi:MAG: energy transducer TonB, partial [Bacteroidales bacterium]|nr:energy transducer TonB [Bacteroidales bacterium]